MEASEIHEYSERLQEGVEKRLTYVSLIIAGLAVLVAIVTVLGHRAHTHSLLEQTRAADQWNEYQSRKMRVHQTQIAIDMLSLQPSIDAAATRATVATYKAQVTKWQASLDQAMEKARELEVSVDHEERQAARFDLGEEMLQIAVVLASITLLTRHPKYVIAALVLALAGLLIAASAFLVK
jgi:aconitase A